MMWYVVPPMRSPGGCVCFDKLLLFCVLCSVRAVSRAQWLRPKDYADGPLLNALSAMDVVF